MPKLFRTLILSLFLMVFISGCDTIGCPPQGSASCDPQLPSLTTDTGWVIDTTHSVSRSTMEALEAEAKAIEKDGFQMAILFVNNAVSDPSKVASDFGNKNGVGSAEKDNGIVILVLLDKPGNDGKKPYLFMAPGKGLSGLTATKLGQVRDNVFIPARKEGKWEAGIVATVKALHALLLNPNMQEYSSNTGSELSGAAIVLLALLLLFVVVIVIGGGGLNSSGGVNGNGFFESVSIGNGGSFGGSGTGG